VPVWLTFKPSIQFLPDENGMPDQIRPGVRLASRLAVGVRLEKMFFIPATRRATMLLPGAAPG